MASLSLEKNAFARLIARFGLVGAGVLCLLLVPVAAWAATFTASLDRDTITLGEMANLSLAFGGGQPQAEPAVPEVPNLQIVYVGPSSSFSYTYGQVSSSVTYNFRVMARQPGDYTIPAITAEVAGQKLTSQPLTLKVIKPSAPPPEAIASGSQLAFLKLILPKKEFFVGETFVAQLQIYVSSRVQGTSQPQLTGFATDGFNMLKMNPGQPRQMQVGNNVYTVSPVDIGLQAVKAGPLTLGPLTLNMIVELPVAGGRPRDPMFDDMFSLFRRRGEQKQLALSTETEQVQVLPVPRDKAPANFTGAVGAYAMSVSAGPTNVTAGDPITVKVQISGRGALDSLTLPDQPGWRDFKTFPPTSKVELTDALGLSGRKTFEQIVTPESPEIKELPPMAFSFFDPERKEFRTLSQPAVPLVVRPGGAAPAPVALAASRNPQENAPPAQDIVPNKQRLGTVAVIGPPLARQTWFMALQGLPVLAFISAVVWRRRTERLANNPRLRRQRAVAGIVREGLAQLQRFATENNSDEFFATVFRLLQERLGERLDVPASAITEAVIEERLRPAGVPENILGPVHELFQTCNLARYAPIKSSQELAGLVSKVESVLDELSKVRV